MCFQAILHCLLPVWTFITQNKDHGAQKVTLTPFHLVSSLFLEFQWKFPPSLWWNRMDSWITKHKTMIFNYFFLHRILIAAFSSFPQADYKPAPRNKERVFTFFTLLSSIEKKHWVFHNNRSKTYGETEDNSSSHWNSENFLAHKINMSKSRGKSLLYFILLLYF